MDTKKKFLIIRLSSLGDIVHSLPVAAALREKFPNAQIDWVVGDKFSDLILNNPLIDNVYVVNLSEWKKNWLSASSIKEIFELHKKLKAQKYDYSIDLQGMFKSLIIQAFCGAKIKVGYKDYREFATLGCNLLVQPKSKRPHKDYHVVRRNLDLLEGASLLTPDELNSITPHAVLPEAGNEVKSIIDNYLSEIDKTKKTIIFAPATTRANKHWAEENWTNLYYELKDRANIIFTGTKANLDLIKRITRGDESAFILAGKTNLNEYIELLRRADLVIGPDSSAVHFAWACGVKTITIFCSTSKNAYAPIGGIAFPTDESCCVPCHKKKCKRKDMICTRATNYKEVCEAVLKEILYE